jgi:hypothetical protein
LTISGVDVDFAEPETIETGTVTEDWSYRGERSTVKKMPETSSERQEQETGERTHAG